MTEAEIRERFDALKTMALDAVARTGDEKVQATRIRAGREASEEVAKQEAGAADARKLVEISVDLLCELFCDLHRIATPAPAPSKSKS